MDLNETRSKNPVHRFINAANKEMECLIPFSSEIKFNAFIRDNNPSVKNPTSAADNLTVYLKGAPERVLSRCTKILINGQAVPFTKELKEEISQANAKFGDMGERVLAFASCQLDPVKYPKASYQFDMKGWKAWGLKVTREDKSPVVCADYDNKPGSFPLHELTLLGVVSLNDPPRVNVDISVTKCRQAGIKVIMVTGDQPATAAAIAN